MADKKISELTALTGANVATDDQLVIVDTSAALTKSITIDEFKNALDTATGFVRITGDTMTGDLVLSGADVTFGDNNKAIFGAASELEIFHTGSASNISSTSDPLKLSAITASANPNIIFEGDASPSVAIRGDGSNTDRLLLRYNDSNDFSYISASGNLSIGATNTGHTLSLTSNDGMFITNGSSNMTITSSSSDIIFKTGTAGSTTERMRIAGAGGVDITGTLTSDGLTVDGSTPSISNGTSPAAFTIGASNGAASNLILKGAAGMEMQTYNGGWKKYFNLAYTGDISFYEDTGTTAKLVWKSADERLGIGTDSPDYQIDIEASSPSARLNSTVNNGVNTIWFGHSDDADAGAIRYWGSAAGLGTYANAMTFNTNGSQAMHIDSSGRLGLKTSANASFNQVAGADLFVLGSGAGDQGMTIYSGNSGTGNIMFADGTTTTNQYEGYVQYVHSDNRLLFGSNHATRMTVENNGDVTIEDGNLVIGTSGHGIDFSATALNGSSELLDDYEKGSWSPEIKYQNATDDSNATNTTQTGTYTKVGNLIFVEFRLIWSLTGSPATDNILIDNLPYSISSTNSNTYSINGIARAVNTSNNTLYYLNRNVAGSDSIIITNNNGDGNQGAIIGANSTNELRGSFVYLGNT